MTVGCSLALLALHTEEARGALPHQWSPQLVEEILAVDAGVNEYPFCQLLAYYRRLDEDNKTAALEHLENALATSAGAGNAFRHCVFLESRLRERDPSTATHPCPLLVGLGAHAAAARAGFRLRCGGGNRDV